MLLHSCHTCQIFHQGLAGLFSPFGKITTDRFWPTKAASFIIPVYEKTNSIFQISDLESTTLVCAVVALLLSS